MILKINGKEDNVAECRNLLDLIESKGLHNKAVVVEHNYKIIKKEQWKDTILGEKDNIEIVSFVGGG